MSWRTSVNQSVAAARLSDVNSFVSEATGATLSPIDQFYQTSRDILRVGTPDLLRAHPSMGPLLLVGLVSTTENYFRDIFTRIIQVCPLAKAAAADQPIKLGSVVWHGGGDAERGAFEHISFADAENISKTCSKYIKYNLKPNAILEEFDKVCEFRHGIVHSSSVIAGKNAIALQIAARSARLKIEVEFPQLQECGDVCTTLVASVNTELFQEMARRWAVVWPKLPSWNSNDEHRLFKFIWNAFYSAQDAANGTIPHNLTLRKCKNRILSEFA